jgi:hypothetical protein
MSLKIKHYLLVLVDHHEGRRPTPHHILNHLGQERDQMVLQHNWYGRSIDLSKYNDNM